MASWGSVTRDSIPSLHYEDDPRNLFNIHLISRLYLPLGHEARDEPDHRSSNSNLQADTTAPCNLEFPCSCLLSSHYLPLFLSLLLFLLMYFIFSSFLPLLDTFPFPPFLDIRLSLHPSNPPIFQTLLKLFTLSS